MTTNDKIKKLRKNCDELWSKCIRTRDKECILCGKKESLAAHHWIRSRAQGNKYRWDIKNGVTLCYACHIYKVHTYASAEIIKQLKNAAFSRNIITPQELDAIANDHTLMKMGVNDFEDVKSYLTAYLEELNNK